MRFFFCDPYWRQSVQGLTISLCGRADLDQDQSGEVTWDSSSTASGRTSGTRPRRHGGRFVRPDAPWRDWITADGKPAPGRTRGFKAEPGRYHLYVSYACPWAHRTLIFRVLKRLEGVISFSVVHHFMGKDGWTFVAEDGATGDDLYGLDFLHQIYTRADPQLHRPGDGAGAVGPQGTDDRLQRILRDHPHAQLGLRRMGRRVGRFLSAKRCVARSMR